MPEDKRNSQYLWAFHGSSLVHAVTSFVKTRGVLLVLNFINLVSMVILLICKVVGW